MIAFFFVTRKYPQRPILGVGAVVVEDGRVLLIKRGREPAKGQWSIPGGAVEVGETIHDALVREVHEETGLLVEVQEQLAVIERIFRDREGNVAYHYVLFDYRAVPKGGELAAASDAADARFFTVDGLGRMELADITKSVVEKGLGKGKDGR
jgi:8-oxo-dGTP diphosphatase